jgi:hypothetical protein
MGVAYNKLKEHQEAMQASIASWGFFNSP